jgi:hypothetical protein
MSAVTFCNCYPSYKLHCVNSYCKFLTFVVTFKHKWARVRKQQTSIPILHLPTKENKLTFSVYRYIPYGTVCIKTAVFIYNIYIWRHIHIYIYTHIIYIHIYYVRYIYMYFCCCFKRKRKSRRFSLILLPFTHRANGSLLFVLTLDYALVCTIRHSTSLLEVSLPESQGSCESSLQQV